MGARLLPFTWPEFEEAIGRELHRDAKLRIARCVGNPNHANWANARSIVVAPQMSEMGQTLWQCVEAVTMTRYPDGPARARVGQPAGRVPDQAALITALCYAAGIPHGRR